MTVSVPLAFVALEAYQYVLGGSNQVHCAPVLYCVINLFLLRKQEPYLWDMAGIGVACVGLAVYRLQPEPGCEVVAELVPESGGPR